MCHCLLVSQHVFRVSPFLGICEWASKSAHVNGHAWDQVYVVIGMQVHLVIGICTATVHMHALDQVYVFIGMQVSPFLEYVNRHAEVYIFMGMHPPPRPFPLAHP